MTQIQAQSTQPNNHQADAGTSQSYSPQNQGSAPPQGISVIDVLIILMIVLPICGFIWNRLSPSLDTFVGLIVGSILAFVFVAWQIHANKRSLILYWIRKGFYKLWAFNKGKNKEHDIFISWDPADLIWAEWIVGTLGDEGYQVVYPSWNGDDFIGHMHEGDQVSRCVIIIWSNAYKNKLEGNSSEAWNEFERRRKSLKGQCLQVLVHPGELHGLDVINLTRWDEAGAKRTLLQAVQSKLGKAKSQFSGGNTNLANSLSGNNTSAASINSSNVATAPPERHFPGANWNVPYGFNPFFVGRTKILNDLYKVFIGANERRANELVRPQALTGLATVGKTEIAAQYAYNNRSHYRYVFWIKTVDRNSLVDGFAHIVKVAKIKGDNQQELLDDQGNPVNEHMLINRVKRWLEDTSDVLLVLDQYDEFDESLMREFLPQKGRSHILLTTCAAFVGAIAEQIEVKDLEPDEEGAKLLLSYSNKKGKDPDRGADLYSAPGISKKVEGLPSALISMGQEIERMGYSVADYFDRFQDKDERIRILNDSPLDASAKSIADRWLSQFNHIQSRKNRVAARLLLFCSFLHQEKISVEEIMRNAAYLDPLLQSLADRNVLIKAIADLRCYSLVQRYENKPAIQLKVHPLLQFSLKELFLKGDAERREMAELVVRAIDLTFADTRNPLFKANISHIIVCAELIDEYAMVSPEAASLLGKLAEYKDGLEYIQEAEKYRERQAKILKDLVPQTAGQQP